MIITRFAPSPTGNLHIGNLRIAYLNYFFSSRFHGKFILRIDDTDKNVYSPVQEIIEDLQWMNIKYDSLIYQSQRYDIYNHYFSLMKKKDLVYPCYETVKELQKQREKQRKKGKPPIYNRSSFYKPQKSRKISHWRFLLPNNQHTEWHDMNNKNISISTSLSFSDPVIMRGDGTFLYTFASVVDDIECGISHIIRGADHIANSAIHIEIMKSLGHSIPCFIHIPLICNDKGQPLSKKNEELSIHKLRKENYHYSAIIDSVVPIDTLEKKKYKENFFDNISFDTFSYSYLDEKNIQYIKKSPHALIHNIIKKKYNINITDDFWNLIKDNINSYKDIYAWYAILHSISHKTKKEYKEYVAKNILFLHDVKDKIYLIHSILNKKNTYDQVIQKFIKQIYSHKKNTMKLIRCILTGESFGPSLQKIFNYLPDDIIAKKVNFFIDAAQDNILKK